VDRWFFTEDLLPKLMIVSNRLLVGRERRPSGASRHQLEARNKIYRTGSVYASTNDKVPTAVVATTHSSQ
jgi:hypothetical protein